MSQSILIPTLLSKSKTLEKPINNVKIKTISDLLMARSNSPSFFDKNGRLVNRRIWGDGSDFERKLVDDFMGKKLNN
jgi:hypothetical protein